MDFYFKTKERLIMNTLKLFFKQEIDNLTRDNVLIFDMHNLIFRTIHVANYSYTQSWSQEVKSGFDGPKAMTEQDMYFYWKYLMLNSVFTAIRNFSPNKLIFAIDGGKGSWRKDIYPLYKANRKVSRDKSTINFENFFPVLDSFLEDMKKAFKNVYFIRLDRVEGDDIIAILSNDILDKNHNITIVSSDRDLVQLMKHKNVKQFDPLKKTFIKSLNPEKDLLIKIISGDSSDNIPAIKKRCGKATALKIINDGIENHLLDEQTKDNYKRNMQLIDFNLIPISIKTNIKNEYLNYKIEKYDGSHMFNFLIKNRANKLIDDLQSIYSPMLKKLG